MANKSEKWRAHWGEWVRARISHLGLQKQHVAEVAGTSPANLSKWFNRPEMPRYLNDENRRALASLLRVHPAEFPYVAEENNPESPGFIHASDALNEADQEWQARRVATKPPATAQEEVELGQRNTIRDVADRLTGADLKRLYRVALLLMSEVVDRSCTPEELAFLKSVRPKSVTLD